MLGYEPTDERAMTLKLNAKPCVLNFISLYAPTSDADDEEIENFYRIVAIKMSKF